MHAAPSSAYRPGTSAPDTADDLEFVHQVFMRLDGSNDFSYLDAVELIESDPGLALINAHVHKKNVTDG